MLFAANNQDRTGRFADHLLCHTPQQHVSDGTTSVRANNNQVDLVALGVSHDLQKGMSLRHLADHRYILFGVALDLLGDLAPIEPNPADANIVGLGEVQFYGVMVPEPSAFVMMASLLLVRARKKR